MRKGEMEKRTRNFSTSPKDDYNNLPTPRSIIKGWRAIKKKQKAGWFYPAM